MVKQKKKLKGGNLGKTKKIVNFWIEICQMLKMKKMGIKWFGLLKIKIKNNNKKKKKKEEGVQFVEKKNVKVVNQS